MEAILKLIGLFTLCVGLSAVGGIGYYLWRSPLKASKGDPRWNKPKRSFIFRRS